MAETEQSARLGRTSPGAKAFLAWGVLRVPVILLILYLFRGPISELSVFDGDAITLRIIDLLSLPISRILLFLAFAGVLAGIAIVSARLRPLHGYLLLTGATLVLTLWLFWSTATPLRHAIIPLILAAANFLPAAVFTRYLDNNVMTAGVGVTEVMAIRRHVSWLAELAGFREVAGRWLVSIGWALAVCVVSASVAVLAKGGSLVSIEQSIRMPATASVIMRGNINGLSLDPATRRLYATGHGLDSVIAFDINDPGRAPSVSEVDSGGSQGIFWNPEKNALIVHDGERKRLLIIDAATLQLARSLDASRLASGDPWVAHDPISGTIAMVSEADMDDGVAFLLVDYATGEILDSRPLDGGNILKHPDKPWLYLSFFRRNPQIMIYDMQAREIIAQKAAPSRLDRMLLLPDDNELLVTSPVKSEILRMDADTLEPKGIIEGPFGVRTLAVDSERNLLFAGSFATGQIAIIDMETLKTIGKVYLGPWLRSIELDVATGTAFVSSNGALYRWSYEQPR